MFSFSLSEGSPNFIFFQFIMDGFIQFYISVHTQLHIAHICHVFVLVC